MKSKMKKPPYISHYLILRDLLKKINVRLMNPSILYLCSRIENIKNDIKNEGIEFQEDIHIETPYSRYKLYKLVETKENLEKARNLLKRYESKDIINFLGKEKAILEELNSDRALEEACEDLLNDTVQCIKNQQ